MTQNSNPESHDIIKEEYLPPPLESNYISLLDIRVKALKKQLTGPESHRIATIKKRIKKFFDYGSIQDPQQSKKGKEKQKVYPPCEISKQKIKDNLIFKTNELIVYGRELNFQEVQKLLPGYVCFEKIDSCNVKLTFAEEQTCKKLISSYLPEAFPSEKTRIKVSSQIKWYDLSKKNNEKVNQIFVRFATNKDDILLQNQNYFRKLLGKIRPYFQNREQEYKRQEEQIQRKIQQRKFKHRKRKFISKPWSKNRSSDAETVYREEIQYSRNTNRDLSFPGRKTKFRNTKYDHSSYFKKSEKNSYFDNLDISSINPVPIDLEKSAPAKVSSILQEKKSQTLYQNLPQFKCLKKKQKPKQQFRDKLIKEWRQKATSPRQYAEKYLKSFNSEDDVSIVVQKKKSKNKSND